MDQVTEVERADLYPELVMGSMTVCLDRAGSVRVTGVVPSDGTLDVTGWAFRPNPFLHGGEMIGDRAGSLRDAGFVPGTPEKLTIVCNHPNGNSYELLVQVRAVPQSTASSGFTIHYQTATGDAEALTIPLRVIMCQHESDRVCQV
jgi:hypothetical protein